MKRQSKRVEPLNYQALGFVRAGKSMLLLFLSKCIYWVFYGQALYINKHPSGGAFMNYKCFA
jgi:hypothetical protein